ncbi:MAG: hypothetical protein ACFCD0_05220 [Gemmataceae bacterium]
MSASNPQTKPTDFKQLTTRSFALVGFLAVVFSLIVFTYPHISKENTEDQTDVAVKVTRERETVQPTAPQCITTPRRPSQDSQPQPVAVVALLPATVTPIDLVASGETKLVRANLKTNANVEVAQRLLFNEIASLAHTLSFQDLVVPNQSEQGTKGTEEPNKLPVVTPIGGNANPGGNDKKDTTSNGKKNGGNVVPPQGGKKNDEKKGSGKKNDKKKGQPVQPPKGGKPKAIDAKFVKKFQDHVDGVKDGTTEDTAIKALMDKNVTVSAQWNAKNKKMIIKGIPAKAGEPKAAMIRKMLRQSIDTYVGQGNFAPADAAKILAAQIDLFVPSDPVKQKPKTPKKGEKIPGPKTTQPVPSPSPTPSVIPGHSYVVPQAYSPCLPSYSPMAHGYSYMPSYSYPVTMGGGYYSTSGCSGLHSGYRGYTSYPAYNGCRSYQVHGGYSYPAAYGGCYSYSNYGRCGSYAPRGCFGGRLFGRRSRCW